jgi:hypothetical protein
MSEFDAKAIGSIVATALKFKEENGDVVVVACPDDAEQIVREAPGLPVVAEAKCKPGEVHFFEKEDYNQWGFSGPEEDA